MKKLLLIAALFMCVPSCKDTDMMTPDEIARSDQLEQEIKAKQIEVDSRTKEIEAAYKLALTSKNAEELQTNLAQIDATKKNWAESAAAWQSKVDEQKAIADTAFKRNMGPLQIFANQIPGGQPVFDILLGLGGMFAFKRPRSHLLDTAKNIGQGSLGTALLSLMKAFGLKSGEDTKITKSDAVIPKTVPSITAVV